MTRLKNLDKLYLVPVLAVRELLTAKSDHDEERILQLKRMRQDLLIAEVDREIGFSEEDVEKLYEVFRYGRRLSLQLFLLPEDLGREASEHEIATRIAKHFEQTISSGTGNEPAPKDDDDYSWDEIINKVVICDHIHFDKTVEIRFKYLALHRFLDQNEDPNQVLETRYGFVWLCLADRYLAVLAKDNAVTEAVVSILGTELKIMPKPVQFPKELVDAHFSIDRAIRLSHLDPETGVRQSISGDSEALSNYLPEIESRDHRYLRPSALYYEEIEQGLKSGIGLTAKNGKIYFTRTLSTSQVHHWVNTRFREFVADLRKTQNKEPEKLFQASAIVARQRHITEVAKMQLERIGDAVVKAKREAIYDVQLNMAVAEIYKQLGSEWLQPRLFCTCTESECNEMSNSCIVCHSSQLDFCDNNLICRKCGNKLSVNDIVTLRCVNGHESCYKMSETLGYIATGKLITLIADLLLSIEMPWDRKCEALYFEGTSLYHLRIPAMNGDTYIVRIGHGNTGIVIGKNNQVLQGVTGRVAHLVGRFFGLPVEKRFPY